MSVFQLLICSLYLFHFRILFHFFEIILCQSLLCQNRMQHRNIGRYIPCGIPEYGIQKFLKSNIQCINGFFNFFLGSRDILALYSCPSISS